MATALQAFTNHEFGTIRTITSGGADPVLRPGCRSLRIGFTGLNCLASRTAPKQIAERLTRVSVTGGTSAPQTRNVYSESASRQMAW